MSGKVLEFGKFSNLEKIAQGGMAEIFKAYAKTPDGKARVVAIKKILPQYSKDEDFITMLTDESRLMVTLNHPNIVPVIEFGVVDQDYYLALEYVFGKTLKEVLFQAAQAKKLFPVEIASYIMREIMQGLDYAHRKKDKEGNDLRIIHRDVSPTNVLISYFGEIKLVDFGIAKASSHSHVTKTGVIRGKLGYMSPEQTKSYLNIDSRSDIFSAGIILYEMMVGRRLFAADTINESIKLVRKGDIVAPSRLRKNIPPFLEGIILQALKLDINQRIQTAAVFKDMLNEFLAGLSIKNSSIKGINRDDVSHFMRGLFRKEYEETINELEKINKLSNKTEAFEISEIVHSRDMQSIVANIDYDPGELDGDVRYEDSSLSEYFKTRDGNTFYENKKSFAVKPMHLYIVGFLLLCFMIIFTEFYVKRLISDKFSNRSLMRYSKTTVDTNPSDARVFLNGKPLDSVTPLKSIMLPLGRKSLLRIEKEGFQSELVSLFPTSTKGEKINLELKKDLNRGELRVLSLPSGAAIILNGYHTNRTTPAVLTDVYVDKPYELLLKLNGYEDTSISFEFDSTRKKFVRLALKKKDE